MAQISFVKTARRGNRLGDAQQVGSPCRGARGVFPGQGSDERGFDARALVVDRVHGATLSFPPMATSQTGNTLRALTTVARGGDPFAAVRAFTRLGAGTRHPLAPAAVRVERSRMVADGARADQTALTVWFGTGPHLPGPTVHGSSARFVTRMAVGVLGAAALGAMGAIAAHREATRVRGVVEVPRLGG